MRALGNRPLPSLFAQNDVTSIIVFARNEAGQINKGHCLELKLGA
jgi:hypothetical protein